MSFDSLGLRAELLRAVSEEGYTQPTPIQSKAIPAVLAGRDVMAAAQTGTGKTAGFTLPMLDLLMRAPQKNNRKIRALVLTPTRELAAQVMENIRTYGKYLPIRANVVYGGVSINPQISALQRGLDILVATPGRLLDHINQGTVSLRDLEILVLDEADRMLDMGFIRDIRKILKLLPENRQNLLFSATFNNEITKLAEGLLDNPEKVAVAAKNTTAERITQVMHPVDRARKRELLSYLIGSGNWQQVLVFARTKHGCDRLVKQLMEDGLTAASIHGNKSQNARTRALADFKRGKVRVLVATDIAARGLDIEELPHVVNFELPNVPEDYVHRIGRTGRAGMEGEAASLVCVDELKLLQDIEKVLNAKIPQQVVTGFEVDPSIAAEPIFKKPRGRNGGGGGRSDGQSKRRPHARKAGGGQNSGKRHGGAKRKRSGGGQRSQGGQGGNRGNGGNR
ncbi:MAG: DEAD/DEAH box helicase [Gammaproteobacteria bacterium]|nr:DEAD/DEAH box helicase [Gammaproteobacteria bacterium]